jgi:carbamoyltransferase
MKLLGFYLGLHDSNLAFYNRDVHYIKAERVFQRKHYRADIKWIEDVCQDSGFIPDVIAYSDGNRNNLGICEPGQLEKRVEGFRLFGKNIPAFCLDHHYAHSLSAWPLLSTSSYDYGITIDGRGDNSFRISIIQKPGSNDPIPILQTKDHAFAKLLNQIGFQMGLQGSYIDFPGKIMGAQAYGNIDEEYLRKNDTIKISRNPMLLIDQILWKGQRPVEIIDFFQFSNESFRDWLATVHNLIGKFVLRIFLENIPIESTVIYSGGVAQNTVINQQLFNKYKRLIIPPHCYDGGISLGCLEFLRNKYKIDEFSNASFPFWQNDPHGGYADKETITRIVDDLLEGKIVGWFQGKGEIGPRALGHRSILLDPRKKNAKDYINEKIKKREYWRPFAPSVIADLSGDIVTDPRPSPYMLSTLDVKREKREEIPGVVHIDGTSRIQTVSKDDPELKSFYSLLTEFYSRTGCPCLLNTSLNSGGGPIISTPEQAIKFWSENPLDVLCVGNKIWEK